MDHFDFGRWADYIHGFVDAPEREEMERHLRDGCQPCQELLALVTRVQQESAAEVSVPEHLIAAAKAVFRPAATVDSAWWNTLPHLAVELVLESFSGAPLQGARSAAAAESQLVYHAGDYAINLQVERDHESNEVALVGQVLDRAHGDNPVSGIPILLTVRNRVIASGSSNRFGEFCLSAPAQLGLRLRIALENAGAQVVIAVPQASEELQ